ncbi:amidohydrolase family protein [Fulvivirgaceae bacterium BMA10]|uniref:Amidohydrolase family protein n=1 Tax=Splendidivirga corallicola TaxID=3051826 RepID=A0ABT8KXR2_9BACT|nr:amidohydrolase family protein [Fulvivirgaceae bacterium BMA10]
MKRCLLLTFVLIMLCFHGFSQETFPINDVKDKRAKAYAFTNATVVVDHKTQIDNATLIIREGKIENVGQGLSVPVGYKVIDLQGKYIYPSLIDIYTNYGLPAVKRVRRSFGRAEQINSKTKGAYNANEAIKAEFNASEAFTASGKEAEKLRKAGFGAVLSFRPDGIARGTSTFVTLGEGTDNNLMLSSKVAAHYSFNKGTSTQMYPTSMMGSIALLRQTYLDADWYKGLQNKPFSDQSLNAWINTQNLPQIFDAGGWLNILRADKVGDEFGKQYIIKGNGNEYQRIKEIKATNAALIIPVNYPDAHDVDDPIDAEGVSLEDMLHWELAPTNLGTLEQNNIQFSITSHQTDGKKFWKNLRQAIKNGLSEEMALKALTSNPAVMINMQHKVGSLKKGMVANFLITSSKLFDEKNIIHENWVQGNRFILKSMDVKDFSGQYALIFNGNTHNLEISGEPGKHKTKIIVNDSTNIEVKSKFDQELVTFNFKPKKDEEGLIRLSGWKAGNNLKGQGQLADGTWIGWTANRTGDLEKKEDKKKKEGKEEEQSLGSVIYPFIAYGNPSLPGQEAILFKNATVWTNESAGIIGETDVLVKDGKIAKIGKDISDNSAKVVDATGKHLTSGIIDEHSHIAASSINDVATNSGMVRIGDVLDPESIHIYRQLSGGVTASQILHGSANPIGGQSALIKLRWGASPEELKIKGADGFIKFALGENVKRSRSSSSIRYPQTRMGVEQVYVDAFTNALEYEKKWNAYNKLSSKQKVNAEKPRRDLVHETMLEILKGKRFISCHSYVQSEINMLMKVAEQFGFRVNTFTHILEGYKVADKMAAHGVGGSTFADWWAYKWEVRYAIPYNPSLMNMAGVIVAINSDDAEMARRLNQEAAKSVKYGGMSEEDAWKMVTLNPAKLLHLDDRMGSVKVGKDADLVLWSDNPLSIYAKAEKTLVDGRVYFDIKKDEEARQALTKERARLVQKMKGVKKSGAPTQKSRSGKDVNWHCDDIVGHTILQFGDR